MKIGYNHSERLVDRSKFSMQFVFFDYPLTTVLGCCSVLAMFGLTWKVRRWKNLFPFLVVSWLVLFGMLAIGIYFVDYVANTAKEGLQNKLSGLAKSFAVALKDAGHENITLDTPSDDPLYWKMIAMMSEWQKQIPAAVSIYTFRKNSDGEIVFICCPPADLNRDGKFEGAKEQLVPKGTVYGFESDEDISEILDAFLGQSGFGDAPAEDDWGLWITAAEPMFAESGDRVDAVLGVDFWGEDWNANVWHAVFWPKLFLMLSIVLFFAVQIFMIRQQIIEDKLTGYAADLERTMDDLVEAKKHADIAVQAKSFFLANISHEIRTPMSAILGCVDMLVHAEEGKTVELNQEQLVDIIQKSSKNLMSIVDDLLTYSSIDTNRIILESVPIDLRQLVADVKIMAGSHLETKPQLQFHTEWKDSVPTKVIGDPARIRRILLALISNAVKFTEIGHITLRCSAIPFSEESERSEMSYPTPISSQTIPFLSPQIAHARGLRGMVHVAHSEQTGLQTLYNLSQTLDKWRASPTALLLRFDVSDTGIGIAEEQFGTLFAPLSQVDDTSTRKFGGIGLGLSIVKGLAQLMGGDVQVTSKLGQGSTFSVFIPVNRCEDSDVPHPHKKRLPQPQETQPESLPLHDYVVLVVDDVMVNRIVVETQLREMGAKVQNAPNGKVAVDLVSEAETPDRSFDFILMDLQMPIMDGFEATRTLRQQGFNNPIIALTANRDSTRKAVDAGCNVVLSKPLDRETLLNAVFSLTRTTKQ